MVGGPQSWELRYGLAVLGKSNAGEVQQRRTGQALGSSVQREEEEEKEEEGRRAILLSGSSEKDTILCGGLGGRSGGQRASDIRAVCLVYPSFFDQRRATHPDQRASVADTHGRYGGEAWLHLALRSRHDLCIAIGWWKALERVVSGVDDEIIVSITPSIDVDVDGRLPRKATGYNNSQQKRC